MNNNTRFNSSNGNLHRTTLSGNLAIIPICIIIFILASNVTVLCVFSRWSKQLQIQHYFMVGLAFADLMTIPPYIVSLIILIRGELWLTNHQCNWLGIAMTMTIEATACIHSLMCIEKCASVLKPIEHKICSSRRSSKLVAIGEVLGCCLAPLVFNLILLHSNKIYFVFDPFAPTCTIGSSIDILLTVGVAFMFLPMLIQIFTHALIIAKLFKLTGVSRARAFRASKTIFMTVGIYYLCWAPVASQFIWIAGGKSNPPGWFVFVSLQILQMNSGMSLVIYVVTLPHFKVFKRLSNRVRIAPSNQTQH